MRLVGSVALGVALLACTTSSEPPQANLATAAELERVDQAEAAWLRLAGTPYEMTFTVDCACPWATQTTTVAGRVGQDVQAGADTPEEVHVDLLFSTVRGMIALDPAVFFVEYEPVTGAPLRIVVEPTRTGYGDEWTFWLTSIRPVGQDGW